MRAIALLVALAALTLSAHAQWTIKTPTTADLRGIVNVGAGIAWASGTDGTVLRTEDGGYVWQRCGIPPNAAHLDFRAIQALDANTAIVMSSGPGDQSRLYKTTDGCQTWTLLVANPDPTGFWDAFAVWSYDQGYPGRQAGVQGFLLGDPVDGRFRLFNLSENPITSGKRPSSNLKLVPDTHPSLAVNPAQAGAFAASNQALFYIPWKAINPSDKQGMIWPFSHVFVTGGTEGARLYEPLPQSGGAGTPTRWKVTGLDLGTGTASSGAFAVYLANDHRAGVIVGGDYLKPDAATRNAVFYDNSTGTWQAATTPPHGYRSAVAYDPTTKTWITVGPNGTDISTDDGRNWRPLHPINNDPPDADRNWNALSLPYAVGPHGRIGILNPSALQPTPTKP